jgi:ribonuclease Y
MEIVIAAVVVALGLAAGLVIAALLLAKRVPGFAAHGSASERKPAARRRTREVKPTAAAAPATDGAGLDRTVAEQRDATIERRLMELERQREQLERREVELGELREHHVRELERASGMSASQAKQHLLKELEDQVRHDGARLVRRIEEETKRDADRRVRNILSVVMQRLAAGHAAETTV